MEKKWLDAKRANFLELIMGNEIQRKENNIFYFMYFNNGMRRVLVDFEHVESNESQIVCVLVAIAGWIGWLSKR